MSPQDQQPSPSPPRRRFPTRAKIIYGYGRLLPYLKWYINTSPFISSDDKDSLRKQLEQVYEDLLDVEQRAAGRIPYPTSVQQKMKKD